MLSTPSRPRKPSPIPSPGRRVFLEEPGVRTSRRLQGHAPEFGQLTSDLERTQARRTVGMTSQSQQTEMFGSPVMYWPIAPRTPASFHGDAFEDVEDWIDQYERVARHNGWTADQCRKSLYFSLEGGARTWLLNHEAALTSWESCKEGLRRSFPNRFRRQRAEDLLKTRTQGPNESVTSFVEDVLRLSARADPLATEETKVRALMRGVRSDIFGGLVRHPPVTVDEFVTEATNIEQALEARSDHYHRLMAAPTISACTTSRLDLGSTDQSCLREIIREVLQEELQKLFPKRERPASVSVAEAVREVQRTLVPGIPIDVVAERPSVTYAAPATQPHSPVAGPCGNTPRQDALESPYFPPPLRPQQRRARKTDVWRTADNRPLCFHCGEPDHTFRRCPYRELGLRGFRPSDPCPRYGQQPREIEEYLRRSSPPLQVAPRGSRSPSPRRPLSPVRSSRRESLSPLRRREN